MIAHLNEAFSDVFKLEVSPVEGQSLLQKDKNRQKKKSQNKSKTKKRCKVTFSKF